MKKVTVRFGSEPREVTVGSSATIGQIISDTSTKVILGYGDNVKALVYGVEQTLDTVPADGTVITLETKANSKAV